MLAIASVALFWPGFAVYDSVAQYAQALSGNYDDWHPPAMARLWAVFGAHGAGPMLAVQLATYWLGLALIAGALAIVGRACAAWLTIAIGCWPPLLGWQAVVLKDTQMLGALLAATGLVAWWRLRGRAVPGWGAAIVAVLLGYAVLVRANAVFAVVPLAAMLVVRRWPVRIVAAIAGVGAVLAALPPVDHAVLRAAPSGVERTEAIYDLAGIAARTGDAAATGLPRAAIAALRAKHCVRAFFWDPLGDPAHCDGDVDGLRAVAPGRLYGMLAAAVVRHPLAYAAHRAAHWNSSERWLVPFHLPNAAPPLKNEPNALGLAAPGVAAMWFERAAGWLVETPLGWPIAWVAIALGGVAAARREEDAAARLALALLVSALALEASFAAVSIASDLRYHLWPIAATALALVMLGRRVKPVPVTVVIVVAAVSGAGVVARMALPVPPQSYRGMLG